MGNMFRVNNNVSIVDFQQVNVSQQPLYKRNDFRHLRPRTTQFPIVKSVQIGSVSWPLFVGYEKKGRISKWVLQENKARQISKKTNIFCHWVFWCASNAGNTGFEIHSFALLPTYCPIYGLQRFIPGKIRTKEKKLTLVHFSHIYLLNFTFSTSLVITYLESLCHWRIWKICFDEFSITKRVTFFKL